MYFNLGLHNATTMNKALKRKSTIVSQLYSLSIACKKSKRSILAVFNDKNIVRICSFPISIKP